MHNRMNENMQNLFTHSKIHNIEHKLVKLCFSFANLQLFKSVKFARLSYY